MPPRPSSRRVSDEGGADYSDDSPIMMSMSQTDRARLDKAQERERTRQRKATEKEHERQRKATDKATDRANKEAAKERAKADKAADKRTQQRASGKHKMREITCVWDTRLGTMGKDFGYMLRAQLKMGVNTNGKVHECLNVSQMLPVERSVTWRYHEPSDEPRGFKVTGLTADVRDGCGFTLVYVPGEDFVEMAWKDHAAAVEAGVGDGDRDAPEPAGGLRSTLRSFKTKLQSHGPNHTLSLLVTNVEGACTLRERRDFRTNGAVAGFSKAPIENALARIYARVYVDVRLTAAPDVKMACEHVVNMHRAWAEKPYVQETTDPVHPGPQRRERHRRGAGCARSGVRRGQERRARRDDIREPGVGFAVFAGRGRGLRARRRPGDPAEEIARAGVGVGADEDPEARGEGGDRHRQAVPDDGGVDGGVRGPERFGGGEKETAQRAGLRGNSRGGDFSEGWGRDQREGVRDVQAAG